MALKSALCAVKISAAYDTIAVQSSRWLQGDFEELQIRNGCSWSRAVLDQSHVTKCRLNRHFVVCPW